MTKRRPKGEQFARFLLGYIQSISTFIERNSYRGSYLLYRNELDEFQAHKFLEAFGETLTVVALREQLRKIDLDVNGKMGLLEYLAFKYDKTVKQILDAPQGDNTAEVHYKKVIIDSII